MKILPIVSTFLLPILMTISLSIALLLQGLPNK